MNSSLPAAQVTWPLQAAIAATFLVAFAGLAWQLKRQGARSLALAWLFTVLALLGAVAAAFGSSYQLMGQMVIAGCVGGSVPGFLSAVDALVRRTAIVTTARLARKTLAWAFACAGIMLTGHVLTVWWGNESPSLSLGIGRLLLLGANGVIAWYALTRAGLADAPYHLVLKVFGVAFVVQAARPLIAALLFADTSVRPLGEPGTLAYVAIQLFITTIAGLASMLLALAEEREAVAVTNRQLREAAIEVERTQRLESVGRLATGVAHDFNNFLAVIKTSTALARDRLTDGECAGDELHAIDDAADRGVALTKQLLTYAKRQPGQLTTFDVVERVRETSGLLKRLAGRHITISISVTSEPLPVTMDVTQFEQILLNLVGNARNAIDGQTGTISVSVTPVTLGTNATVVDVDLPPGDYAVLQVSDSGRGIPSDILRNIFDPFFTTRVAEGGTGLGLSTVLGIVRQAGGDITVSSTEGEGSTFTVLLPQTI